MHALLAKWLILKTLLCLSILYGFPMVMLWYTLHCLRWPGSCDDFSYWNVLCLYIVHCASICILRARCPVWWTGDWRCRIGRIHLLEGWKISAYDWSHMPTTLRVCGCIMKVIWIARSDTKSLSSYWFGLSTWFWLEVFMYLSSILRLLTTYS